jgi:outer membrane protein
MTEKLVALERGRLYPTLALTASMGTGFSEASMRFEAREPLGAVEIGYLADGTSVFTDGYYNRFGRKPWEDQIRDNFNQFVGVYMSIPIFNRWNVRTRVQQSRVELERSRNRFDLARNNLHKAIHQAHADAVAAWQRYQATTKSLDAFEESFKYTRERYELGMVSTVEFNEAQSRLARAERDALQSRYDFIFKLKVMEFYMGEGFNL